ncbi:hypothetical protein McanMca71_002709 [Microsporum canis]|uniref:Uncharacterized protein n=1 Tax=Arthroderma otae (strain ATCC MYA-4605 / CBS 113480) TaxID=554155 RepID=C5FW29_ARTOC|nr:uncharacterized protein MCYG_06932 [Microsporum canis CBS 113480]EEQ34113.1 predicted protein [Microsporum canis CBS 113480]
MAAAGATMAIGQRRLEQNRQERRRQRQKNQKAASQTSSPGAGVGQDRSSSDTKLDAGYLSSPDSGYDPDVSSDTETDQAHACMQFKGFSTRVGAEQSAPT